MQNRYWRKNRSTRPGSKCYGVDLNRNFDVHWLETGSDDDPCSYELYAGPAPFSELESQAVSNVMSYYGNQIKLYITLHTFGNKFLYPFGYTNKYIPKDVNKLRSLGNIMARAVERTSGKKYDVEAAGSLYEASGGSDDFAYCIAKIPYVYTFELTDGYDFDYPAFKLQSLYHEIMPAFKVAARVIGKMKVR